MNAELNELHRSVISKNLAEMDETDQRKLVEGLSAVPIRKIFDQIQYLENKILPQIRDSKGENSDQYKFYSDLLDTLMWSAFIHDRYTWLHSRYKHLQLLNEFFVQEAQSARSELEKYHAAEDIVMNKTLSHYAASFSSRIEEMIKNINSK